MNHLQIPTAAILDTLTLLANAGDMLSIDDEDITTVLGNGSTATLCQGFSAAPEKDAAMLRQIWLHGSAQASTQRVNALPLIRSNGATLARARTISQALVELMQEDEAQVLSLSLSRSAHLPEGGLHLIVVTVPQQQV